MYSHSCNYGCGKAEQALKHARSRNRFVEPYLTGKKKLPRTMPDSYSFGSGEEALICIECLGEAWAAHREALIWLLMQVEEVPETHPLQKKRPENSGQPLLYSELLAASTDCATKKLSL